MSIRTLLKLLNVLAISLIVFVAINGEAAGLAWLPSLIAAACAVHFIIDAWIAWQRLARLHRIRDLSEFAANHAFGITELAATFGDRQAVGDLVLPVRLAGRLQGSHPRSAPVSGKPSLAWQVEAELTGGVFLIPGDADPLPLDSWWGEMDLQEAGAKLAIRGPGLLDPSAASEKTLAYPSIAKKFPALAKELADQVNLPAAQLAKAHFVLREIALFPGQPVEIIGQAGIQSGQLAISGTDQAEDPEGLFVRPANQVRQSWHFRWKNRLILGCGLVSTLICLTLVVLRLTDPSHQGRLLVEADGRNLRLTIDGKTWSFDSGDKRTPVPLETDNQDLVVKNTAMLKIERLRVHPIDLVPGDPAYPRWDGSAWSLVLGETAKNASLSPDLDQRGRLLIRNLTKQRVAIRVLSPDGNARGGLEWTFDPKAWADRSLGSWLTDGASTPFQVGPGDRLELTTKQGYRRILPLSSGAKWRNRDWHLDLVDELLAGAGKLYVRNLGKQAAQIWILGVDGNYLHGQTPWEFDAHEGSDNNRGLALQENEQDISFSGRETVRYGLVTGKVVFEGPLDRLAGWKQDHWELALIQAGE